MLLAVVCGIPEIAQSCQPEPYYLFREEARRALDSLQDSTSIQSAFTKMVLMHNLGFHKDKFMRERAEHMLDRHFPANQRTPLEKAYGGSLQMIKVSHRTRGSNILRSANPFVKSPLAEARAGFRVISDALDVDSTNVIIRALRATAAAESADHLSELFATAQCDLIWLESHIAKKDTVLQFVVNLNWAKYYYKLAKTSHDKDDIRRAEKRVDRAKDYACTPVYAGWAAEWEKRIADLADR